MQSQICTSTGGPWFQWRPLDPDPTQKQVRLLTLAQGSFHDPIQCRLDHVELDRCKPYEALSYEWGPIPRCSADQPVIYINECLKRVRPSLLEALLHIRKPDQDRYIWIDALCIYQDDEDDVARAEKKRSIMMMGDIYRRAARVLVWLGLGTSDSDKAMATINWIHQNIPAGETRYIGFSWVSPDLGCHDDGREQQVSDSALETIDLLCQRSYWTRMWMIQELHLAAELEIYCGTSCTTDAAFQSTFIYLYHDPRTKDGEFGHIIRSIPFDFHFNYRQPGYKRDSRKLTFSFWISAAIEKGFECYNPHDVAYALRGPSYRISDEEVVPDYQKCMECVFTDTLTAWATGNLEAEYGSGKFVTHDEAVMLANRLLPGRRAGHVQQSWVDYNKEQFQELFNWARDEWQQRRMEGKYSFINEPWYDGLVGREEVESRRKARQETLALLRRDLKR